MRYDVNIFTLGKLMLPPMFRSKFICALVYVLLLPIIYVYSLFAQLRDITDKKLNITPNVIVLEKVLNETCGTTGIYIVTPDLTTSLSLYLKSEGKPQTYFGKKTESKLQYMCKSYELNTDSSFIVRIPQSADSYVNDVNVKKVQSTLNLYKPAGKTFRTELYNI